MIEECVTKQTPRSRQARAYGPDRDGKYRRRFVVSPFIEGNELEHSAMVKRKVVQCTGEMLHYIERIFVGDTTTTGPPPHFVFRGLTSTREGSLLDLLASPPPIVRVTANREEPVLAVRRGKIMVPIVQRAREGVLDEIVGVRPIACERLCVPRDVGETHQRMPLE